MAYDSKNNLLNKSENKKRELQNNWDNTTREYYAIVSGKMPKQKDTLKSYLVEDKTLNVHSTKNPRIGKLAITEYEVIASDSAFSLLKINIKTGRKNQIRVQLSDIGHPIVGDKKYGCKHNIMRRMALHAYLVELTSKGKTYKFITDYPKEFKRMFNV
jgi:23S rRNA pseudouridine1911/1915/1917 synthase